ARGDGPIRLRLLLIATALLVALTAALPAAASAQTAPDAATTATTAPLPGETAATPLPSDVPATPSDFQISGPEALRIADSDANVNEKRAQYGELTSSLEVKPGEWEVSFFAAGRKVVLV